MTPHTQAELKEYDPNISWAKHTVEITYQQLDYKAVVQVTLNENCKGAAILKTALSIHGDQLYEAQGDPARMILRRPTKDGEGEDTLETESGEDGIDTWLESMCVGIRIVGHEKTERAKK